MATRLTARAGDFSPNFHLSLGSLSSCPCRATPLVVFFPLPAFFVVGAVSGVSLSLSREVICVCVVLFGSRLWGVRPPVFDLKIVATTAGFDVTTVFSSSTGALSRCSGPTPGALAGPLGCVRLHIRLNRAWFLVSAGWLVSPVSHDVP